ncbi:MAG: hypothetical protein EB168_04500 [Euryarchaeota archaeon]|jgi:hypothetical protein|nr:hypothetical protein [Euryarchaeota archaeon]
MNETVVVLAIIMGSGTINQDIKFSTLEDCERARANVVKHESFCYTPPAMNFDQMGDMLSRMKEALESAIRQTDQKTAPTL